jgi:hypothetical protein
MITGKDSDDFTLEGTFDPAHMVFRQIYKRYQVFRLRRFLTPSEREELATRLDELTETEAFERLFLPARALRHADPNAVILVKNVLARVAKEREAKGAK